MSSVWIINQYATHPSRGGMSRHFMLGRELAKLGHEITIISTTGHYFHDLPPIKHGSDNPETVEEVKFIWLKTPSYNQSQKFIRIFAWIWFTLQLLFLRKNQNLKPDIIWHSSPSLLPYIGSYFLSLRFKSILYFEFRDVWPLTFTSMGGYSKHHPFIVFHNWIERFALNSCDICISTLEFGWRRLEELNVSTDKFNWIANGVKISEFVNPLKIETKSNSKTENSKFVFGYIGSIGVANSLVTVIDAAVHLKDKAISITIIGDGSEKHALQKKAKLLKLTNVNFLDKIPKQNIPTTLNGMDACILTWQSLDLYRFGTSANKCAEYLAAGKPIINAYSGIGDFVTNYKVGITVEANDCKSLADAMIKMSNAEQNLLKLYSRNALAAAVEHYDYKNLAIKLSKIFHS